MLTKNYPNAFTALLQVLCVLNGPVNDCKYLGGKKLRLLTMCVDFVGRSEFLNKDDPVKLFICTSVEKLSFFRRMK